VARYPLQDRRRRSHDEPGSRRWEHRDQLERRRLLWCVRELNQREHGAGHDDPVYSTLDTAAMARPRVRDNSTQAEVTQSTYRRRKSERAPPVAATTAVMSAVSSRQMNHARRRGWAGGPNRSNAPDDARATTSARASTSRSPATRPGETNGPSASSTTATPSRAQASPRSGPPTLNALHYFINVTRRKIGRYIATTRPPTTTPRKTIMMGSSKDVSAVTAVSTSSS